MGVAREWLSGEQPVDPLGKAEPGVRILQEQPCHGNKMDDKTNEVNRMNSATGSEIECHTDKDRLNHNDHDKWDRRQKRHTPNRRSHQDDRRHNDQAFMNLRLFAIGNCSCKETAKQ